MNVAVTGCFGFVGSHIVERLTEAGHSISLLDLPYWDLAGPPHGHNGPWLPQHIAAIVHCAAIPISRAVSRQPQGAAAMLNAPDADERVSR